MRISDWSSDVCSSDLSTYTQTLDRSASTYSSVCGVTYSPSRAPTLTTMPANGDWIGTECATSRVFSSRCTCERGRSSNNSRCRALCASCRSEEHTSELQSLMRNSYAVFCLKKKKTNKTVGQPISMQ